MHWSFKKVCLPIVTANILRRKRVSTCAQEIQYSCTELCRALPNITTMDSMLGRFSIHFKLELRGIILVFGEKDIEIEN